MFKRFVVRLSLLSMLLLWGGGAQALVLAINEGVTYQVNRDEVAQRYAGVAADLSRLLKQPVSVEVVTDYPSLRKGLGEKRFDLALIHPAHVSIQAIKQSGFRLVAVVRGFQGYQAQFLVDGKSPLTSLQQLKGAHLGAPDEDSITSVMVRAALRDAGLAPQDVRITYTRYQDAVPFFIENGLTAAGATASTKVVKAWLDKGGKLLGKSRAVPIKHVIASPLLSLEQVEQVRDYLLTLDASVDGRKRLEAMRYPGFDRFEQADLLALGTWLGL